MDLTAYVPNLLNEKTSTFETDKSRVKISTNENAKDIIQDVFAKLWAKRKILTIHTSLINIKMIKQTKLTLTILLLSIFIAANVHAQQSTPRYWGAIQKFKKQDSISPPQKGQILFIGSSSFTKWKDVQDYFPKYPIINRGFGGATLNDLIYYVNDVVFPYQPKQIVIFCGGNDLSGNKTLTPEDVSKRFETLFDLIRKKDPKVAIAYLSIKPSPSQMGLRPKFDGTSQLIKAFLSKKKNTAYIDVTKGMYNADGSLKEEIFGEDRSHMNEKGYVIWKEIMEPYLIK